MRGKFGGGMRFLRARVDDTATLFARSVVQGKRRGCNVRRYVVQRWADVLSRGEVAYVCGGWNERDEHDRLRGTGEALQRWHLHHASMHAQQFLL